MHTHIYNIIQYKSVITISKTEPTKLLKIWPIIPWAVRGKKAESNVKWTKALNYQRLPILRVRKPML